MASVTNKSQPGDQNCGDKNCPKHGQKVTATIRNSTIRPKVASVSESNVPSHLSRRPPSSDQKSTLKVNAPHASTNNAGGGSTQQAAGNLASKKGSGVPKDIDFEDIIVQGVQSKLRIGMSKPSTGGTNNVMTFITNNNSVESQYMPFPTATPSVSPVKSEASSERFRTSSCSSMYDQMRMEHTMKENVILQSITIKQGEEIQDLKDKVQELLAKLNKDEQEKRQLQAKIKNYRKAADDFNARIKGYEETVKNLKSKLHYTDLKAKQLKRMASENASTASKWRAKMMESLQAQKELEEKKNAYDKAALGLYRQFQEEKKKIIDLKRRHGDPITESDFDDTVSTTDGTLNTTMLEAVSSPLTSTPN